MLVTYNQLFEGGGTQLKGEGERGLWEAALKDIASLSKGILGYVVSLVLKPHLLLGPGLPLLQIPGIGHG